MRERAGDIVQMQNMRDAPVDTSPEYDVPASFLPLIQGVVQALRLHKISFLEYGRYP